MDPLVVRKGAVMGQGASAVVSALRMQDAGLQREVDSYTGGCGLVVKAVPQVSDDKRRKILRVVFGDYPFRGPHLPEWKRRKARLQNCGIFLSLPEAMREGLCVYKSKKMRRDLGLYKECFYHVFRAFHRAGIEEVALPSVQTICTWHAYIVAYTSFIYFSTWPCSNAHQYLYVQFIADLSTYYANFSNAPNFR